ncbi:MAG: hypothetical protein BWZ10_03476 [candidate division BRC1 bacterium ADurb.BinA364]|nr:MAG: hypothetical protein BWZ10_03476 [candidate division BRC1 bacterium ADurb.BinA364]
MLPLDAETALSVRFPFSATEPEAVKDGVQNAAMWSLFAGIPLPKASSNRRGGGSSRATDRLSQLQAADWPAPEPEVERVVSRIIVESPRAPHCAPIKPCGPLNAVLPEPPLW